MTPTWLKPLYRPECVSLGGNAVTLTNLPVAYDSNAAQRGLGIALVDMTNVTEIEFRVSVNKVGAGQQDWQLWNETDGAQIGVISDTGATGNKFLSATFSGLNLTGFKLLRVRAKGNATDDPVYYGSTISLR